MSQSITVILITAAAFLAVVTSLAAKKRYAAYLTGSAMTLAGIGGLFLYGYGCAMQANSLPLAVTRALLNTCYMFLGKNEYSLLKDTPLCAGEAGRFLFWFVHFLALYATAGTVIITVGSKILKKMRFVLSRRRDLVLIYGTNDSSVSFGCELIKKKKNVIFINDDESDGMSNRIITAGSILLTDNNACVPDGHFLRSIGVRPGKRKITVYALHSDSSKNADYAAALLSALEQRKIEPEQTMLIISGVREEDGGWLQKTDGRYGFGSVFAFEKAQLAARLLVQQYPPCNTINFNENGLAQDDFEALLVGFGKFGQAVLQQLVMNGQFAGSSFRLSIFSPDCRQVDGLFRASCPAAQEEYQIDFYEADARSREMYEFLSCHRQTLKYVVVAAGGDKMNREIRRELQKELSRLHSSAQIYECGSGGVAFSAKAGHPMEKHPLLTTQSLDPEKLDSMAVALNQAYCKQNGKTADENWAACDYFSRLSCRASADFVPAILRASGKTAEDVLQNGWHPEKELQQNLGKSEHLRWCAFHYMMGFRTMPREVFDSRAQAYRQEMTRRGSCPFKIGKDMDERLHACLVPWDDLDALSQKENEITGKNIDYKQMDLDNVALLPQLLEAAKDREEKAI